jgi:hypothetical protein
MAPRQKFQTDLQFELPSTSIQFDNQSFQDSIESQGIELEHHACIPCPIGKIERGDLRISHEGHSCSNGFIYDYSGTVRALMTNNSKDLKNTEIGIVPGATMYTTFQKTYIDGNQFHPTKFDRFYPKASTTENLVPNWERITYNSTGIDRAQFPIEKVLNLIDSTGESFKQDIDFIIEKGNIVWTGIKRPWTDLQQGGGLIAVRYLFRGFWYAAHLMHELRYSASAEVIETEEGLQEKTFMNRMPLQAILQREFLFQNTEQNQENGEPRQNSDAPNGSFKANGKY